MPIPTPRLLVVSVVGRSAAFWVAVFHGTADVRMNDSGTKATFSLWSRNLLDEAHIYRRSAANAAVLGDYANFNTPRTFGGEVAVAF